MVERLMPKVSAIAWAVRSRESGKQQSLGS
jgi:hypothetical protein